MRHVFIVVLFVLIPIGSVAQDSSPKRDGRMWQMFSNSGSQSTFIKAAYVQGAVEGLRVGAVVGYLSGRLDEQHDALNYVKQCIEKGPCAGIPLADLIKPPSNDAMATFGAGVDKVQDQFTPQGISLLDIVHQMDKFYSDYRNTPVCMIQAVQESISSLRGKASPEEALDMMRKSACNP